MNELNRKLWLSFYIVFNMFKSVSEESVAEIENKTNFGSNNSIDARDFYLI